MFIYKLTIIFFSTFNLRELKKLNKLSLYFFASFLQSLLTQLDKNFFFFGILTFLVSVVKKLNNE